MAGNTIEGFYKIVKYEGVRTLWRGLTPTLLMTIPGISLYYTIYEHLYAMSGVSFVSGCVARTVTVYTTAPLELLRTYSQSKRKTKNMFEVVNTTIKQRGILGMWMGTGPTMLRDIPFSGIFWTINEWFRAALANEKKELSNFFFLSTFLAGAVSGSIAGFVTHPADVIKTRLQMTVDRADCDGEVTGRVATLREVSTSLWQKEGIRGFYRGLGSRIFRIAVACAIMLSSYEMFKSRVKGFAEEE